MPLYQEDCFDQDHAATSFALLRCSNQRTIKYVRIVMSTFFALIDTRAAPRPLSLFFFFFFFLLVFSSFFFFAFWFVVNAKPVRK